MRNRGPLSRWHIDGGPCGTGGACVSEGRERCRTWTSCAASCIRRCRTRRRRPRLRRRGTRYRFRRRFRRSSRRPWRAVEPRRCSPTNGASRLHRGRLSWRCVEPGPKAKVDGLPAGFRFQDLRHYFASLLIPVRTDVKVVQARMRHALPRRRWTPTGTPGRTLTTVRGRPCLRPWRRVLRTIGGLERRPDHISAGQTVHTRYMS
jgi:hypothetical protein